ncbi:MAG: hypothetical protein CK538_02840 [Opitutia bacterium]|nr:hypothetical protein [Opitutaceae bacterium]PHX86541.1 MAG: hypothetical protein CK538_02840 [Opitutae bacterium]
MPLTVAIGPTSFQAGPLFGSLVLPAGRPKTISARADGTATGPNHAAKMNTINRSLADKSIAGI